MSFECPHCDNEIDTVGRTGEKRYTCSSCSKVLKYDEYVAPNLNDLEVIDKRGNSNSDQEDSSNKEQDEKMDQPNHSLNERELIQQRGREGLKEVKEERLSNWLSMTDGVGGTTENRIIMVFNSDKTYRENPNALYNLLDEELSSSASYINTIVNQVFAPEKEHEDLLKDKGFRSYLGQNNATSGAQYNQPHNNQGPSMSMEGMNSQGYNQQNQNHQQPQQQGGGGDSLSREEAVELVAAATQTEQGDGRGIGQTASEGLNQATEEAIQNLATNAGGFFSAGQKFLEEALIGYAKKNPEKIVDNMDMFQTLMNMNENEPEPQTNEQDQKVDDAVEQAMNQSAGQRNRNSQQGQGMRTTQNRPQNNTPPQQTNQEQLRNPRRNNTQDQTASDPERHSSEESGFEPDDDILGSIGGDSSSTEDNDSNSNTSSNDTSSPEEDESFDELFGDLEE